MVANKSSAKGSSTFYPEKIIAPRDERGLLRHEVTMIKHIGFADDSAEDAAKTARLEDACRQLNILAGNSDIVRSEDKAARSLIAALQLVVQQLASRPRWQNEARGIEEEEKHLADLQSTLRADRKVFENALSMLIARLGDTRGREGSEVARRECPELLLRAYKPEPGGRPRGLYSRKVPDHLSGFPKEKQIYIDHFSGELVESPMLSAFESPGRILNFLRGQQLSEWKVAVIDTMELERVGIQFERSTTLADRRSFNPRSWREPNGVPFVTYTHWLIHGWVPEECIIAVVGLARFEELCREKNIANRENGSVDDVRCAGRLTREDLCRVAEKGTVRG